MQNILSNFNFVIQFIRISIFVERKLPLVGRHIVKSADIDVKGICIDFIILFLDGLFRT